MKKCNIPKDVKAICEQVARGYERRKKDYERKRFDIIYHSNAGGFTGSHTGGSHDPCAVKAERLEALENSIDARMIHAVDESLRAVGTDVSRDCREKLCKSILLNCEDGYEYPYEILCIDNFSRREFYRRRKEFIVGIGISLGIIDSINN